LFYDTVSDDLSNPNVKIIGSFQGLALNQMSVYKDGSSGLEWVPRLDMIPYKVKKLPLQRWLEKVVVIDGKDRKFTRGDLILCVCDKDGGAHIDPILEEDYADLSRHNSMGWKLKGRNGEEIDEEGPHLACIRQIAHEILKSLKDEFPN